MARPEVTLLREMRCLVSGGTTWRREYAVCGGDVTPDWARTIRPPSAPWCHVVLWQRDYRLVPRDPEGGTWISSYSGEVWPTAWPILFEIRSRRRSPGIRLTLAGEAAFASATPSENAGVTDDEIRALRAALLVEWGAQGKRTEWPEARALLVDTISALDPASQGRAEARARVAAAVAARGGEGR